ncbi:hypothetical protein HW571_28170 [Agrobacterium genomosp. 3]|uniref:hypothetical protein n=1 Tax=Agrobacterium tomkonis TaxID=1183410 RepID=UPI001CD9092C|nr:hypothetical protein [Agrobacterium tomkonis]MCA1879848.1 hypothetical protein [Agrobacterium tumefaciens]MCA1895068.1 hypothetical protein [Agrobacterium tomkonis]
MDEINADLAPYGITGAWRVTDVESAYDVATNVLRHAYIQPDFFEFQNLKEIDAMKASISRALMGRNLLDANIPFQAAPWAEQVLPVQQGSDQVDDDPSAIFRP